jgi:hypothetical protein
MLLRQSANAGIALRFATLLLIVFVHCLGAQNTSQQSPGKAKSPCQLTQGDYAVYAALAEALSLPEHPENASQRKENLIADTTAAPRDIRSHFGTWGYRSKSKAAPGKDTVAAFERKAQSSCLLHPEFGDRKSYKVITQGDVDKAFKDGGWQGFYKEHPEAGGYWIFSRPGYNSERNKAVLSVSHWCGELCGTGYLYFLTKQNDQWKVQNRLMLWIS